MKNYQKPIVLLNSNLSEGVYAASGDTGGYEVIENGSGTDYKDYLLSTTNQGTEHIDSITFTVSVYGAVTRVEGLKSADVTAQLLNPTTASVTYTNGGYGIKAGETVGSIPVRVYGSGDYGIR